MLSIGELLREVILDCLRSLSSDNRKDFRHTCPRNTLSGLPISSIGSHPPFNIHRMDVLTSSLILHTNRISPTRSAPLHCGCCKHNNSTICMCKRQLLHYNEWLGNMRHWDELCGKLAFVFINFKLTKQYMFHKHGSAVCRIASVCTLTNNFDNCKAQPNKKNMGGW